MMVEEYLGKAEQMYAVFMDLEKVYYRVDRDSGTFLKFMEF